MGRRIVRKLFNRINDKFNQAYEKCRNFRGCLYISLMEAKPKRKDSFNYYEEAKGL